MPLPTPPTTLFDVPLALDAADAAGLREGLSELWRSLADRPMGPLADDLGVLAKWWHPRLRGGTLRDRLADLPRVSVGADTLYLSDRLVAWVEPGAGVITVEGRLVLGILEDLRASDDHVVIPVSAVSGANAVVAACYADWAQHRLRDVISLLRGEGPPLLPPVLAFLVLLLVNRSTSEARGVSLATRDRELVATIDAAMAEALSGFADSIKEPSDRRRDPRHFSLYGGYRLSEASRRLGASLVRSNDRVFIADGRDAEVIDLVARDLARREELDEDQVGNAFDVLVERIRGPVGRLALHGSAHERVADTRRLRATLIEAFVGHRESTSPG